MTLPDCPSCDASGTLEARRADGKGYVWVWCSCCSKTALVGPDGRVVHKGT